MEIAKTQKRTNGASSIIKALTFLSRSVFAYEYLAVVGLFTLTLIITSEVIIRRFGTSFFPLVEISATILVIMSFASTGSVFRLERQLRMDLFLMRLSAKWRPAVEAIQGILALAITVLVTYLWAKMCYGMYRSQLSLDLTHYPVWPFQALVVVGWIVMIIGEIHFIASKVLLFLSAKKKDESSLPDNSLSGKSDSQFDKPSSSHEW